MLAAEWPRGGPPDDWQPRIDDALHAALSEMAGGQWSSEDVRFLAEIESRTLEYLEQFDEEPIGISYYPYSAIMLILTGLPILTNGDPEAKIINSLWEYSRRFSAHVDWELRNSRILTAEPNIFERCEERIWFRVSRLSDEDAGEFATLVNASCEFSLECLGMLSLAFREEATADFVVIFDDTRRSSLKGALQREVCGLRVAQSDSIYSARMDDANRTYFERPGCIYVWGSGEALADFLREFGDVRTLVDSRRPDGMVLDGASFIANPVNSTLSW